MIRFTCQECGRPVRVPDALAGKKGRCPHCKQVIQVPVAEPPPTGEVADLAAALPAQRPQPPAEPPRPPPPPPEPSLQDVDIEPELLESAGDPSHKTDRLDTLGEEIVVEDAEPAGARRPESPGKIRQAEAPARKARPKVATIGSVLAGAALIATGAVLAIRQPWKDQDPTDRPAPQPVAHTPGEPALPRPEPITPIPVPPGPEPDLPVPTPPQPVPPLPPSWDRSGLSAEVAAVVDRAPVGTFAVFHVDFERTARAVGALPRDDEVLEALAGSGLWNDARKRIADGALPRTATLYLTGADETVAAMFGKLHPAAPAGGWTLATPGASVPHFLLRITGPAAVKYSKALIARASSAGPGLPFLPDRVATYARLRMVPSAAAGMDKAGEMLVGTVETLTDAGACRVNPELHGRLGGLLRKVPTTRPVVGCARLDIMRIRVGVATGSDEVPPVWSSQATVLVFSIEPGPEGKADLVLSNVPAEALAAVESMAAPMVAVPEGRDVRLSGRGAHGLVALANLLPGFQEVALRALALAGPAATAPEPVPKPAPEPEPAPTPRPAPAGKLPFLCVNQQCSTGGKMFEVAAADVSADVRAGHAALLCPHCGKNTAALAVKCPHCGTWYVRNLDLCPNPKCNKPRE